MFIVFFGILLVNKINQMSLLKVQQNTDLNEYVIKLLNKNKIYTVIEFLNENIQKLKKITNLDFQSLCHIKTVLKKKYGGHVWGKVDFEKFKNNTVIIPSGVKSLDELLNGGLTTGNLYEFCGLPASGKTQLCNTILMNISQYLKFESLYIDTKNDFSGKRIHKILSARNFSEADIGFIMKRIRVERVYNVNDFINLLKTLLETEEVISVLKIIVIDSLPSIWFLFHGEKTKEGLCLLTEATHLMRRIANEYFTIIITVNLVTRRTDFELEENNSVESQTTIKPSLGKYWQTVPTARLIIEEMHNVPVSVLTAKPSTSSSSTPGTSSSFQPLLAGTTNDTDSSYKITDQRRSIRIIKSNLYKTGKKCIFHITDKEENNSVESQTTIKPSLGKYWQTVPTARLIIEEMHNVPVSVLTAKPSTSSSSTPGTSSSFQPLLAGTTNDTDSSYKITDQRRSIRIIKSNLYKTGKKCIFHITDKGCI